MSKTKKSKKPRALSPIPPAGMRPDSLGKGGAPNPSAESLREEYAWREEHIQ